MLRIYKPIGKTCGEVVDAIPQKAAYCGRLDPMAHGQMLCLIGPEAANVKKHLQHDKTYEFRFVTGISTDTTDVMGLFNNENYQDEIDLNDIIEYIKNMAINKKFPQKYHKFSSFMPKEKINISIDTSKRKPLWYWSTNNLICPDYYKDVMIYSLNIDHIKEIKLKDVITEALHNLHQVTNPGEFRLEQIIYNWQHINAEREQTLTEFKITIKVSSGFYIRQFVQDIADHFKAKLMVLEIHRSSVDTINIE
jgi:tRNA U55 pseudouridine synthase TruB